MDRLRSLGGLCVLVVALLAVSGAQAAQYGRCVKVAKINKEYKGNYEDKGCTKAVAETGRYEWIPGPGPKPAFTVQLKRVTLTSPNVEFTVSCSAATGSGSITGATSGNETLTLTSCSSSSAGGKCNSSGEPPGIIKTHTLATELSEPSPGNVLTVLNPAPWYSYAAEFECKEVLGRVRGSLGGVTMKLNGMQTKFSEVFQGEPQTGGQKALTEISITGGLSWKPGPSSLYPEGAPTSITGAASVANGEKMEIKTL
jgi:hypothetical protein